MGLQNTVKSFCLLFTCDIKVFWVLSNNTSKNNPAEKSGSKIKETTTNVGIRMSLFKHWELIRLLFFGNTRALIDTDYRLPTIIYSKINSKTIKISI